MQGRCATLRHCPRVADQAEPRAPRSAPRHGRAPGAALQARCGSDDRSWTASTGRAPPSLARAAALHALAALQALAVLGGAFTPLADAALSNPNTRLPRNADVALRRAIPIVNAPTGRVQERLEQILFLLRIPQRKPWGDMASALASSQAALVSDRDSILGAVPAAEREAAAATLASLAVKLERLQAAVAQQDADVTALRASQALADLAALEIAQAPGLPYLLPTQYASRPRLVGRAVVELTVARGGGSRFEPLSDGAGPQPTGRLVVTLDGYNAPLSSANFAALVAKGFFDGVPLSGSQADETLFALPAAAPPPPFSPTLPLELRSTSEFEPRYRAPLDVIDSGELPVLPLSVYGALAWARGTEGNDSSASQFFFFRFARQTAGLGGAAFDEGQYAVFGYVTEGNEILKQLRTGDVIKNARLVSGAERLVTPPATP